jgi:hypothetical protein
MTSQIDTPGLTVDDNQNAMMQQIHRNQSETEQMIVQPTENVNLTRSGRVIRAPERYSDYVAFESVVQQGQVDYEPDVQFEHPLALASSSDPDVMYLHQTLKEPDRLEFIKAMEKEVRSHTENANCNKSRHHAKVT